MLKKLILSLLCFLVALVMLGCGKPSGDPKAVLQKYYTAIETGDALAAYECLTEKIKANVNKDDLVNRLKVQRIFSTYKGYSLGTATDQGEKELNGQKYKNVFSFTVSEKIVRHGQDKETFGNYVTYVVNDNGNWRVHSPIYDDPKKVFSNTYANLGWYYLQESKDYNLVEAIAALKKAVQYNDNNFSAHWGLARAFSQAKRFTEAIVEAKKAIEIAEDNKAKGTAYVELGVIFANTNNYYESAIAFQEAIKVDPENEYAKNNLRVQQINLGDVTVTLNKGQASQQTKEKIGSCIIVDAQVQDPDPPLNTRSKPDVLSSLTGQLPNGTFLKVFEEQDGWLRVETMDGKIKGWVAKNRVNYKCQ